MARKAACQSGSVAVEFAMIGPILFMTLFGIIAYGGYFWTAHAVQQIANDAARAAIVGASAQERSQLIVSAVSAEAGDYVFLDAARAVVAVRDMSDRYAVSVTYDASDSPFFAAAGIVPMPPATIVRQATVRLGGY